MIQRLVTVLGFFDLEAVLLQEGPDHQASLLGVVDHQNPRADPRTGPRPLADLLPEHPLDLDQGGLALRRPTRGRPRAASASRPGPPHDARSPTPSAARRPAEKRSELPIMTSLTGRRPRYPVKPQSVQPTARTTGSCPVPLRRAAPRPGSASRSPAPRSCCTRVGAAAGRSRRAAPGRSSRTEAPCRRGEPPSATASLAWTVVSTRCPVIAACAAVTAVSLSRISPTRMTSGSCRSIARRALAKVIPCLV